MICNFYVSEGPRRRGVLLFFLVLRHFLQEKVMEAGGDMIIANGRDPAILYDLLDGKAIGTRFIGKK